MTNTYRSLLMIGLILAVSRSIHHLQNDDDYDGDDCDDDYDGNDDDDDYDDYDGNDDDDDDDDDDIGESCHTLAMVVIWHFESCWYFMNGDF